jgi:hypothetical protein
MIRLPRTFIGVAVAISSLLSSAASAQTRSSDFRSHEDFSGLQTYAFKGVSPTATETENTTTYDSPLIDERIRDAVAAQLESRGFRRVDRDPDMYVVTRRSYKTEYTYYSPFGWGWGPGLWGPYGWGAYYGYGWADWGGYGPIYQDERILGRMTVDLEKASSGRLIWRGVGEKHVHETSKPSSRDRRVNEQIEKIFKDFPPRGR